MCSKRKSDAAVGFPPPLLGADPVRLPILFDTQSCLALDKPAGVGTRAHPWDAGLPDLDEALNVQLQAGKPELKRLGASLFGSVYYLDPEVAGIALFAKHREALADLRDRFGSGQGAWSFRFVAGTAPEGALEIEADAPLLPHRVKPKMIPSTAKGKKCVTRFRQMTASAGRALWEARCDFFRPHQVRAHAAVSGIPILGDELYAGPALPTFRDLDLGKRGRSGPDKVAFRGLPIRLCKLRLPSMVTDLEIESVPGKPLEVFLKQLGLG